MEFKYQPLLVSAHGMISSMAVGSDENYLAYLCGYDGFKKSSWYEPYSSNLQICSTADDFLNSYGAQRYIDMANYALKDLFSKVDLKEKSKIEIILCLSDQRKIPLCSDDYLSFMKLAIQDTPLEKFYFSMSVILLDRCSHVSALERSRNLLYGETVDYCLVIGVDSLINSKSLKAYSGNMYGDGRRILGEGFSDGFIPGEAAACILLEKPDAHTDNNAVVISGIGMAEENVVVSQHESVVFSDGLVKASKKSLYESRKLMSEIDFRMASVSGESFFFKELAIAQRRLLDKKVQDQVLWHPADAIGECGSAIGIIINIFSAFLIEDKRNNYKSSICMISNDDSYRGAYVLNLLGEYHGK